jgi:hypothetical protein
MEVTMHDMELNIRAREVKPHQFDCIPTRQRNLRLKSLTLPKRVKDDFLSLYERWIEGSGVSWTVNRLKLFKEELILEYSGGVPSYLWFKKSRSGNLIGTFGSLRAIALSGSLRSVIDLIQIYSEWKKTKLDSQDVAKMRASIEAPPTDSSVWGSLLARAKAMMSNSDLFHRIDVDWPIPVLQNKMKADHMQRLIFDLCTIPNLKRYSSKLDLNHLLERGVGARFTPPLSPLLCEEDLIVGSVQVTPNPGLKTRYYGAPNVFLQRCLDPLKKGLGAVCQRLPWDCTFDQSKADKAIISRLRSGKKVYSVDMSSATDHFPWWWQNHVLGHLTGGGGRKLSTRMQVELLRTAITKGKWILNVTDSPDDECWITWTKGQPLGLGPSFFLFTISHGVLLWVLSRTWENKFFVLGDDVVILDDALYEEYRHHLEAAEIPISEGKTYTSNRYASFAGKSYTASGCWYNPKWEVISKRNFLDVARYWRYWRNTELFQEKELIAWVLSLPEPYGSGENPLGLSLDARLTPELVEKIETSRSQETLMTHYSCVSWKSVRDLPENMRRILFRELEIVPHYSCRKCDQHFSNEMMELLWQSSIPLFPVGPSARKDTRWTLGSASFWRRLHTETLSPNGEQSLGHE